MKRTYIDAGILIAAIRGIEPIAKKAIAILDEFITTENLTKPLYRTTSIRVVALHTIGEETMQREEE